jgi:hypothetical protein
VGTVLGLFWPVASQARAGPVPNTANGIQADGASWGILSAVSTHHMDGVARPSLVQRWQNRDVVEVVRKGEARGWRRACFGQRVLTERAVRRWVAKPERRDGDSQRWRCSDNRRRLWFVPVIRGGEGVGVGPLEFKKGGVRGELTGGAESVATRLQFRCGSALQWWNSDRRQGGRGRGVPAAWEEEEKGNGSSGDAAAPFQSGTMGI